MGSYVGQTEAEWRGRLHRKTEGASRCDAAASECPSKSWWQVHLEGRGASPPRTGGSARALLTPTDTARDPHGPPLPRGLCEHQ